MKVDKDMYAVKKRSGSNMCEPLRCPSCDKELSPSKGELDHGCLNCAYLPKGLYVPEAQKKLEKLQTIVDIYEKANESILMWGAIYPEDIYPTARKARIEVDKIRGLK